VIKKPDREAGCFIESLKSPPQLNDIHEVFYAIFPIYQMLIIMHFRSPFLHAHVLFHVVMTGQLLMFGHMMLLFSNPYLFTQ
jgi:hypothetical protein